MDLFDDRRFYIKRLRECAGGFSRGMSFRRGRREHFLHGFAFGDAFTECAVAALFGETGDREIAHAAEAIEGIGLRACRRAEPPHLAQAACDERGLGVIAELEAVARACSDGHHIF